MPCHHFRSQKTVFAQNEHSEACRSRGQLSAASVGFSKSSSQGQQVRMAQIHRLDFGIHMDSWTLTPTVNEGPLYSDLIPDIYEHLSSYRVFHTKISDGLAVLSWSLTKGTILERPLANTVCLHQPNVTSAAEARGRQPRHWSAAPVPLDIGGNKCGGMVEGRNWVGVGGLRGLLLRLGAGMGCSQ